MDQWISMTQVRLGWGKNSMHKDGVKPLYSQLMNHRIEINLRLTGNVSFNFQFYFVISQGREGVIRDFRAVIETSLVITNILHKTTCNIVKSSYIYCIRGT